MSAESKGIIAQIVVGVVTGILVGLLAGSGTAFAMVSHLRSELAVHVASAESELEQVKRDVSRLESKDSVIEGSFAGMNNSMASMATSIAVLAEKYARLESDEDEG